MATFTGRVRKAFNSQATLQNQREHCSLDPQRLASLGIPVGSQIRIKRQADQLALFTISETRNETAENTVRMIQAARERLGIPDEFDAAVDTRVPHPTFTDDEAREHSEFVERLDDDGGQQQLVVLAPHGGAIELRTDDQAELVRSCLGDDLASVWRCKGFRVGGGALLSWHIRSIDLSNQSFPLLKSIACRGFAHAVAFHGMSKPGVIVGGAAPKALKRQVVDEIRRALASSTIEVRLATASDELDGDDPANVVNRLTTGGHNGVQLEQSEEARDRFWQEIAHAVVCVYRSTLEGKTLSAGGSV
jgi:phage replication-related protein YjqB (UPF0714/DUF867 family)